jgi:SpoVK/Ycf46/Vps4 family AAA+-type ATPase
VFLPDAV